MAVAACSDGSVFRFLAALATVYSGIGPWFAPVQRMLVCGDRLFDHGHEAACGGRRSRWRSIGWHGCVVFSKQETPVEPQYYKCLKERIPDRRMEFRVPQDEPKDEKFNLLDGNCRPGSC